MSDENDFHLKWGWIWLALSAYLDEYSIDAVVYAYVDVSLCVMCVCVVYLCVVIVNVVSFTLNLFA